MSPRRHSQNGIRDCISANLQSSESTGQKHISHPGSYRSSGKGSNSIELRLPDGEQEERVQFYDRYAGKTQARIRVLPNGGALDVDVTTG
jgi:uncharacterized protein YfaP (DUF2135 family)